MTILYVESTDRYAVTLFNAVDDTNNVDMISFSTNRLCKEVWRHVVKFNYLYHDGKTKRLYLVYDSELI